MRPLVLLASTLLLAACEGDFASTPDGTEQIWAYTATTPGGVVLVSGTFRVIAEGRDFKGSWATHLVLPNADVGPQVGTGTLRGSWDIEGQTIGLDLNPGWADNNVFLTGRFVGRDLEGTWVHSTLTGPRVAGEFVARRVN